MAGICTVTTSPGNCSHRTLTVVLDGESHELQVSEAEASSALTTDERLLLLRLAIRHRGVALANLLHRVVVGDEANNVRQHILLGPGAAITRTNIGTAYVNVLNGANGERSLVDFEGCTEFRAVLHANLVATGPFQIRLIRDSDSAVLYESPSLTQTGERELDTDWQPLPAAFQGQGLTLVRLQAKSATGADDPVFRSCKVGTR